MALNTSVMGIYPDQPTLSDAVSVLRKGGYRSADISVLSSDNQGSKDFGIEHRARAFEIAAIGAAVGAVIGAALAWLVSIQALPIPNSGLVVAAGSIIATLAGAGAGGAIGWLAGLAAGSTMPEYVAKRYTGRMRQCGTLLSVHCDSREWCDRAKKILKDTGARNISSRSETKADYGSTDRPTDRLPVTVVTQAETPAQPAPEYSVNDTRL